MEERVETAVYACLHAFPIPLCDCTASPAEIAAYLLSSPAIRTAAQRAKQATAALSAAAADGAVSALEAGLAVLHDGLRARAPAAATRHPSLQQLKLLRMLFVSAVLLLDAALGLHAPDAAPKIVQLLNALRARHAAAAMHDLACLALGAVAVPQLAALEERLLSQAGSDGSLHQIVIGALSSRDSGRSSHGEASSSEPLMQPTVRVVDAEGARRALALRWASIALSTPALASHVWPSLHPVLDASTRLLAADGSAYRMASVSLVRAALGGLSVEIPTQLQLASEVIECLRSRCHELLATTPADAAAAAAMAGGSGGGGGLPRSLPSSPIDADMIFEPDFFDGSSTRWMLARASRVESLCSLLFSLLSEIKEPLLPPLLEGARSLVLAAAPRRDALCAACCAQLRGAVSVMPHGERKRQLVAWLFELRAEVLALEEAAERKRGNTTAQQQQAATPPPWLGSPREKQRLLTADAYAGGWTALHGV
jgi:hypothetical protein